MTRKEILAIFNQKRIDDWNDYRKRNPNWIPDLTDIMFPSFDLKGLDLRNADLRGADLSQCNIETFWSCKIKGAKYDAFTKWKDGFDPLIHEAIFVSERDENTDKNVKVFISYAWTNKDVVLAIDQWLRSKNFETKIDEKDFFAGNRIREEIIRVMNSCNIILIFYSKFSANKPWPEFERFLAQDLEMEAKTKGKTPPKVIYIVTDYLSLPDIYEKNRIAIMASGKLFPEVCDELYNHIKGIIRTPQLIDLDKWKKYKF